MMLIGCMLVLFSAADIISAFGTCYPVNGQDYCFYSEDLELSWDEARKFCAIRGSTLPIITDKHIDRAFQQFISDNNIVTGPDTEQTGNYVGQWLDLHAGRVDDSDQWHWINGKPSALKTSNLASRIWSTCITLSHHYAPDLDDNTNWNQKRSYICQYHTVTKTEVNCTTKWVQHQNKTAIGSILHGGTTTLGQCKKACEFDPRCVAIDYGRECLINIYPSHMHWQHSDQNLRHYELDRRCNIATETNCGGGIVYNSRCYKIHRERVNWFTAVNRCLANNGSLASFDDNILKYFATILLTEGPIWIGLIRSWWTWPDAGDTDVLFNKFDTTSYYAPHNPPIYRNSGYDCVVATTGYWRLSRCSDTQRVVCQSVGPLTTPTRTEITASSTTASELTSRSAKLPVIVPLVKDKRASLTDMSNYRAITISSALSKLFEGKQTSSPSGLKRIPLIAGVVAAFVVVALIDVVVIVVVCRRHRHSGQQPMPQTGDSSDTGQYESISSSTPNVVYAHINPAQESEPEYANVR